MGGFFKLLLGTVRRLDMFPSGQLLRYKSQPVYRSVTGGVISIVILAVLTALCATEAMQTLNRQIIISKNQINKHVEPIPSQLAFDATKGFNFAILVSVQRASGLLDMHDPSVRYFDVELIHWERLPDITYKRTDLPLTECTLEHFSRSPELVEWIPSAQLRRMVCPDLNGIPFILQGASVSSKSSFLELKIKKCNSSKYSNCISDEALTELQARAGGAFQSMLFLMGNAISPESQEYRQPYIDSRKRFTFTLTDGLVADVYLQEDIVRTDYGLTPIPQIQEEKVIIVDEYVLTRPLSTINGNLMSIYIAKSPLQSIYDRRFQKIDQFFSYVGGIIGTIIGILFLLTFYSRQAYSISIASQLYLSQEGDKISSRAFHLGYFLLIPLKRLLNMLCCSFNWQRTDFYMRCMDEANQQLDVITMMKKIIFLEKAMGLLFTKHQLESLYLFQRERIDQAESRRKKHELGRKLDVKNNQVYPSEGPVKLQEEVGESNLNPLTKAGQVLQEYEEFSHKSVSQVDPRSQERIKTYIKTLMKESRQGNKMSNMIAHNIDPKVLDSMGVERKEVVPVTEDGVAEDEECKKESKVRFKIRRLEPIDRQSRKGLKTVSFNKTASENNSEASN